MKERLIFVLVILFFLYVLSGTFLCTSLKERISYYQNDTCQIYAINCVTKCWGYMNRSDCWGIFHSDEKFYKGQIVPCLVIHWGSGRCIVALTPLDDVYDYENYLQLRKENIKKIIINNFVLLFIFLFVTFIAVLVEWCRRPKKMYAKIDESGSEDEIPVNDDA